MEVPWSMECLSLAGIYEPLMIPGWCAEPPDLAHITTTEHMDYHHGSAVLSNQVCSNSLMSSFLDTKSYRTYARYAFTGNSIQSV